MSRKLSGFSLIELLIAVGIMAVVFSTVVVAFIRSIELTELSRNSSIAAFAVKNRIEQIRNFSNKDQIVSVYHEKSFDNAQIIGKGVSYIEVNSINVTTNEINFHVSFCWKERNGRVIGEDSNLNGLLDSGEDKNMNDKIDSPVTMEGLIFWKKSS